jgi:hypothetical protein
MTGSNRRPPACKAGALPAELILHIISDPYGIRTRVTAVKGRCLNHLTNGPKFQCKASNRDRTGDLFLTMEVLCLLSYGSMAPQVGFEPTTVRLTAECSTTELLRNDTSLATSYSRRGKAPTTLGAEELNFRVRNGNGCDLFAIITRPI